LSATFPAKLRDRILPWVFAGPALALLAVFLVYPAAGTILRSFQDEQGALTVDNYAVMPSPNSSDPSQQRHLAGRRHRRQRAARTHHSRALRSRPARVGARRSSSCRWRSRSSARRHLGLHVRWQPAGQPQIGLLNAIVVAFGGEPIPWLTTSPINIFCEI
jgi:ABC-type sugar transport system permease subunit